MAKRKIYAVKRGRQTGLFNTWDDCKAQVHGYSDAAFKSFESVEEAEAYLQDGTKTDLAAPLWSKVEEETSDMDSILNITNEQEVDFEIEEISSEKTGSKHLSAFVDGSFNATDSSYGSGAVLMAENRIIALISVRGDDESLATMRNVAGEIKASELSMRLALSNGYDSITIYYDYAGVEKWCTGEWRTNTVGTKSYNTFFEAIKNRLKIDFVKVKAHSGDRLNDMADKIAKKAVNLV